MTESKAIVNGARPAGLALPLDLLRGALSQRDIAEV